MNESLPLYSVAQVRDLDRRAIERHGISGIELMQRAGGAVLRALRARFPRARRIAIVCGPGNNGGDGYVVARLAHAAGLEPILFALGDSSKASVDATAARVHAEAAGIVAHPFTVPRLRDADVVVDALLGIGLERAVQGEWRAVIEAINDARRPVVAIDIPSGLNADTGAVMGVAVRAQVTVSFIGLKIGLYTSAGRAHAGEIIFDDLGVPGDVYRLVEPNVLRLSPASLNGKVAARARDAHKGSFGHVLVVGAGPGMAGAAALCGEAAYRAGAGLVTLAMHPDHATSITRVRPELLCHSVRGASTLKPLVERADVLALGPGLSQTPWAKQIFRAALSAQRPLVIDADGLNLLATKKIKRRDWVLTPHPGEAARLLGTTVAKIQHDRVAATRAIVNRYGGVCVLKGSGTLVAAASEQPLRLCDAGNAGMAKGGTGDALTGIIATLLAQGLSAFDAACVGTWAHAAAGDAAAARCGETGMLASDLNAHIGAQLDKLRS